MSETRAILIGRRVTDITTTCGTNLGAYGWLGGVHHISLKAGMLRYICVASLTLIISTVVILGLGCQNREYRGGTRTLAKRRYFNAPGAIPGQFFASN